MSDEQNQSVTERIPWIAKTWDTLDKMRYSLNSSKWVMELHDWITSGKCYESNNDLTWKVEKDCKETPFKIEIFICISRKE